MKRDLTGSGAGLSFYLPMDMVDFFGNLHDFFLQGFDIWMQVGKDGVFVLGDAFDPLGLAA